ncbi:hypothetical protein [Pseudonocardia sp. GCM10023141]|uniref:hypothetical protein n=1 Tax=Pseudonocardia sp. GCM10023141 TaxID=3252653 RepID=UPI00361C0678
MRRADELSGTVIAGSLRLDLTRTYGGRASYSITIAGAPYAGRGALTPDLSCVVVTGSHDASRAMPHHLTCWRPLDPLVLSVRIPEGDDGNRFMTFGVAVDDEGCHAVGAGSDGRAHIWDLHSGGPDHDRRRSGAAHQRCRAARPPGCRRRALR